MQTDKKNCFFTSETYQHWILSLVSSIVTQSPHNLRILPGGGGVLDPSLGIGVPPRV